MSKRTTVLLIAVASGLLVGGLALFYHLPIDTRDRSPVQPVDFSHSRHVAENGIDCLYCHRQAQQTAVAGIPEVASCVECHLHIAADAPEVKAMMDFWQRKQPIPWVRVHHLPDHVYFSHRMHLRAGIDCAACHGDVGTMDRVTRIASLKMGWCLSCHKDRQASIDCWTCHI